MIKKATLKRRHPAIREHKADIWTREQIARADSYSVFFLKGPGVRFREPAGTLVEAEAIAERMNREHGKYGRRACIYAVFEDGTRPIPLGESYKTAASRR